MKLQALLTGRALTAFLIVIAWASACKTSDFLKQKVENRSEFVASPAIESCGTVLSLGEGDPGQGPQAFSLIAQAAVCGRLEGHDEPWQAIGLTMVASEVTIKSLSGVNQGKAPVIVSDGQVFASLPGQKIKLGEVQGEAVQDASVRLADNVKIDLLVDGKVYVAGSLDKKDGQQQAEILFTIP